MAIIEYLLSWARMNGSLVGAVLAVASLASIGYGGHLLHPSLGYILPGALVWIDLMIAGWKGVK